ncbi:VanZ family protein [Robertmurraya sp. P23]|uniref:VanZ family protein n=1 Tax=Robertmurraya sp. P23 TaxID=3436931 RepID=UPI003D9966FF
MEETRSIMFTIQSWHVLAPVFVLGLLWLARWIVRQERKINLAQLAVLSSFGIYLLCVMHFVFFPIDVNLGIYANQTPWYKTINFIPILTIDVTTFLLNIIMLIPFGMYIPFLKKNVVSLKKVAKLGLMMSLSLEVLQLLFRVTLGSGRSTDINDLLANTSGAVIGFLLIRVLLNVTPLKSMLRSFQL